MDPKSNTRMATLLRYTYRANMVFAAGFAAWYALGAPRGEESVPVPGEGRKGVVEKRREEGR
jgi:hypothetical protein